MERRSFAIGNDQFRDVREQGAYYVDKTLLIRDFILANDKVSLVTRPRRFGKTLNTTMLRDFFDITQDSRRIFDGLAIMDTEFAGQINTRPVICFSFKDCGGRNQEELRLGLSMELLKEYDRYARLLEADGREMGTFERIFWRDKAALETGSAAFGQMAFMIENLTRIARELYGTAPLLLMDEYDQPILSSHEHGYHDELGDFFTRLYGSALKGNENLWQAWLTGIQRVAKESVFSKLNNVRVYTVLDKRYSAYFGLTEEETDTLLRTYDRELNEQVKARYDGYQFGAYEMYNPWSVLNYADSGQLRNYWVNTSTNTLIHRALEHAGDFFRKYFDRLITSAQVTVGVNLESSFLEIQDDYSLWGLLVNSGYLTVAENEDDFLMSVRIPNEEVASEFQKLVAGYSHIANQDLELMFRSLLRQDMEQFMDIYSRIVLDCTSYYDASENSYHMLFLGMCIALRGLYRVISNREHGYGRSDIRMEALKPGYVHVIVEFKQGRNIGQLKEEALNQILDNQYYAGLQGEVLCIGVAHDKKKCEMAYKKIHIR